MLNFKYSTRDTNEKKTEVVKEVKTCLNSEILIELWNNGIQKK